MDLVDKWLKELSELVPDKIERYDTSLGYHLDEYWHVFYDIVTRQASVEFECYPYYIPDSFKAKAVEIATSYYNDIFDKITSVVLELIKEANRRDIVPTKINLPHWFLSETKIKMMYGIKVGIGASGSVEVKAPEFFFAAERKI
jgi:hypothetical protein